MSRKISRYYWACQLTGWGLLSLMFIILNLIYNQYGIVKITEKMTILFFSGIIATHIFRNLILKHDLLRLTFKEGLPRLFVGIIITSAVAGFIRVASDSLTTPLISNKQFTLSIRLIFSSLECTFFISTWTLIYYLYCYMGKTRKERLEKIKLELLFEEMKAQSTASHVDIDFITDSLNQIQTLVDKNPARARIEITEFSNLLRRAHLIPS